MKIKTSVTLCDTVLAAVDRHAGKDAKPAPPLFFIIMLPMIMGMVMIAIFWITEYLRFSVRLVEKPVGSFYLGSAHIT